MSDTDRNAKVVVVDRDPFAVSKGGQWARVIGVLHSDEITIRWTKELSPKSSSSSSASSSSQRWWKWNLVVYLLDSTNKEAIPLVLCYNPDLAKIVHTFVSVSAAHLRDGGFVRLNPSYHHATRPRLQPQPRPRALALAPVRALTPTRTGPDGWMDWDDVIRDALFGDTMTSLSLMQVGEFVAAIRCECLRLTVRGEPVNEVIIRGMVTRLLAAKDENTPLLPLPPPRKRKKKKKKEDPERDEEEKEDRRATMAEFWRYKHEKTYSLNNNNNNNAVVSPFTARFFVRRLDQFYDNNGRDGHPGYMQTVARFADGLPLWDRVFVEEWSALGIDAPTPPRYDRMVLLQYPNGNGMGYSFAVCDATNLETLIAKTDQPTFSEVFRCDDLVFTAIPVDWDMPVDQVVGTKWYPERWLERIQHAADAALRYLLPSLQTTPSTPKRQPLVQIRMWISEEMMAALTPDGGVDIQGLDKITVHANLLLPANVIVWNSKALRTVYEEMERQDNLLVKPSHWFLDKSITKLRLPGCFKRLDDDTYVHRLVPWHGTPANAYEALVHAKHDVPACQGVDVAVLRSWSSSSRTMYGVREENREDGDDEEKELSFEEAIQAIRRTLSQRSEMATLELERAPKPPFVQVRKRTGMTKNNWCIIKGAPHRQATMYFVVGTRGRAWIHCRSDRCQTQRLKMSKKPYIDLYESRICAYDSSSPSGKS